MFSSSTQLNYAEHFVKFGLTVIKNVFCFVLFLSVTCLAKNTPALIAADFSTCDITKGLISLSAVWKVEQQQQKLFSCSLTELRGRIIVPKLWQKGFLHCRESLLSLWWFLFFFFFFLSFKTCAGKKKKIKNDRMAHGSYFIYAKLRFCSLLPPNTFFCCRPCRWRRICVRPRLSLRTLFSSFWTGWFKSADLFPSFFSFLLCCT